VPEAISKMLAAIQTSMAAILATTKTHKWWWAGGGGTALVAVIALVVVFGGFFGPSGKQICTITLDRAKDYGVLPGTASLANFEAKKDDQVSGRRLCTAEVGANKFILTVDLVCKDLKKSDCLSLYAVEREDGLTTYQKRQPVPDDAEAAMPVPPVQQPAADAAPAADAMQSAPTTDTAAPATGGQNALGGDSSDVQPATGSNATQSSPPATPQQ
jgi:hypothetical protein